MDHWIIDRFEGDFAVCEDANFIIKNIPRNLLPNEANEGDALVYSQNKWTIDVKYTLARRKRINSLANQLFDP